MKDIEMQKVLKGGLYKSNMEKSTTTDIINIILQALHFVIQMNKTWLCIFLYAYIMRKFSP